VKTNLIHINRENNSIALYYWTGVGPNSTPPTVPASRKNWMAIYSR